ncbi:MAG: YIP1 family protein [Pseudomonadota bacterium]
MNTETLKPLFALTLQNPRAAAERVIALGLPASVWWMLLSLTVVLSSLYMVGRFLAAPLPPAVVEELSKTANGQQTLLMYSLFTDSPIFTTLMLFGFTVLMVHVLCWVGRALGGQGSLLDILSVFTLLQVMTLLLSFGLFLISLIVPALAALGSLVFLAWTLWAITSFLDAAHGFNNPFKAFGVLIASFVAVLFGASIAMGVLGGLILGITGGAGNV